jgi:recombination protein RecR
MSKLEHRMQNSKITEIILATNSTVEGQATAHFIGEVAAKYQIRTTRIAHGIPMGGELEFIDSSTLSHAFNGRKEI